MQDSTGTVTAFDEHRGLGAITTTGGTVLAFHCTAIVDGTRTIEVGTAVRFETVPGRMGRWEAAAIAPVPGVAAPAPRATPAR